MAAQITASEGDYVTVKMPSGELRLINRECYATIGQIGNTDHINIMLGKAGRNRWLGRRGISRDGAEPGGLPDGRRPGQEQGRWWVASSGLALGKLAKGGTTRRKKKYSNGMIVERRKK